MGVVVRVGFFSLDWSNIRDEDDLPTPGGAGFYRCVQPAKALAAHGYDTSYGARLDVAADGSLTLVDWHDEHHECDLIVMQRWMEGFAPDVVRRARSAGQIIVNDVDDWMDGVDTSNIFFQVSHPKTNPRSNRDHYRKVLAASTGLTVSTPYLAERYERINPNVVVVRNMVDLEMFPVRDVSGPPVVGWVGATQFRSRDLEQLGGIGWFFERYQIRFHHSGSWDGTPNAAELAGLTGASPTYHPMAAIPDYPKLFAGFNIGIVPLSDTPFNMAKSAIKGMEYAASGIPFVASSTPEYEWLREEHGIGFTAKNSKQFQSRIHDLLDEDMRIELGAEYRRKIAALSVDEKWADRVSVYEQMIGVRA